MKLKIEVLSHASSQTSSLARAYKLQLPAPRYQQRPSHFALCGTTRMNQIAHRPSLQNRDSAIVFDLAFLLQPGPPPVPHSGEGTHMIRAPAFLWTLIFVRARTRRLWGNFKLTGVDSALALWGGDFHAPPASA